MVIVIARWLEGMNIRDTVYNNDERQVELNSVVLSLWLAHTAVLQPM